MTRLFVFGVLLLLILTLPMSGFGATFKLNSNEIIKGMLLELNPVAVKIQSEYGSVTVPVKKIVQMNFAGENNFYKITLKDKSVVKGNLISLDSGSFVVNMGAGIINIEQGKILHIIEKGYITRIQEQRKSKKLKSIQTRVN